MSRAKIAFVSPCGFGNLGDAAIIDSLLHAIRERQPGSEIVGFTLNPADTFERHGIPAGPCGPSAMPRREGDSDGVKPARAPLRGAARRAARWVPGARHIARVGSLALADRRTLRASRARVEGFDWIVIAGGGQLDEFWGGPWGHPYSLWCWARVARQVGARFGVLSVGTGSLRTPLSRWFVRRTLASADYRSFRDVRSRELVGVRRLTASDPIVPDLAYGLPLARAPKSVSGGPHAVIGVNPMCYARPRSWPVPDAERYARHVREMAEMAVRGVGDGHEVVLFATTLEDRKAVEDVKLTVLQQLGPQEHTRVRTPAVAGVSALMDVLASVDVVVSARLHGVLLSHLAGRPALALAHERKVATLMADMNQSRFCLGIDEFDAAAGWGLMGDLLRGRERLSACILEAVADCRHRVSEQYDRVFGSDRE